MNLLPQNAINISDIPLNHFSCNCQLCLPCTNIKIIISIPTIAVKRTELAKWIECAIELFKRFSLADIILILEEKCCSHVRKLKWERAWISLFNIANCHSNSKWPDCKTHNGNVERMASGATERERVEKMSAIHNYWTYQMWTKLVCLIEFFLLFTFLFFTWLNSLLL